MSGGGSSAPATGQVSSCPQLRVSHIVYNGRIALYPPIGPLLFLDEANKRYFKRYIVELVRSAVLDQLAERIAPSTPDGKPKRKDLFGLHRYVDIGATFACLSIILAKFQVIRNKSLMNSRGFPMSLSSY